MLDAARAFSGFSVDDIPAAKRFYGETLGLPVTDSDGMLDIRLAENKSVFVYPKPNHEAATYTILNFPVPDIDRAVDELTAAGVKFEHYDGEYGTDAKGIARGAGGGPPIAWFRDPAGNILAVLQLD